MATAELLATTPTVTNAAMVKNFRMTIPPDGPDPTILDKEAPRGRQPANAGEHGDKALRKRCHIWMAARQTCTDNAYIATDPGHT
ncbi:MAG TPA: hypothetical protein VGB85_17175, partial [Nannocystis sp.]